MYAYIKGEITYRSPAFLVIEAGGVGYHINIPLSTYSALAGQERATVYIHQIVREDAHTLYGFATQAERSLFVQLIGVTGVGATTAQLIMSSMTVDEVRAAVIGEQVHVLQRVKGIGAKTAKQIILDLKSRFSKEAPESGAVLLPTMADNQVREEALSALIALGFQRIAVQKALNAVLKESPNLTRVEDLIKAALKALA
ncbi:MAG TPA: Holliday junction branch migration protein RuvA [Saprospiraceae bacterium]|nr:Holliday junction branch migration protein RuvA [Saprospiraceae bacterium]